MEKLISDSHTLPTQSRDCTLDQQYIIIYVIPAITLILEGKLHQIQQLSKDLQTPSPESPFQVGDAQLKAIRELTEIFDAEIKIPNRDALPIPPRLSNEKRNKLPRVEDHTAPSPNVDPDQESNSREQKLPSPVQTTPSSEATRKKYTQNLKELVKQRRRGHYTGKSMTYRGENTDTIPECKEQEWS